MEGIIGFKAMYQSAVLGLDVDDHETGGWIKGKATGSCVGEMTVALMDRVRKVKRAIGLEPSMMVRSSRGMHLFWFWIGPVYLNDATSIAVQRLHASGDEDLVAHVDILPQHNIVIRIPKRTWIIRPGSACERLYDRRRDGDAHLNIEDFTIYDFEDFEEAFPVGVGGTSGSIASSGTPSAVMPDSETSMPVESDIGVEDETRDKVSEVSIDEVAVLDSVALPGVVDHSDAPKCREDAERDVMPFRNGETNQQLGLMVIAGMYEALSFEEIERWVTDWIDRSRKLGYTGDLGNNPDSLRRRIETYGRRVKLPAISYEVLWNRIKDDVEIDSAVVDELMRLLSSRIRTRQKPSVIRFIRVLIGWMDGLDRIVPGDPELHALVGRHSGYGMLRRKGWYPLPSRLLQSWYDNYKLVLDWLIEEGVATQRSHYHPEHGPRWYSIDLPGIRKLHISLM